MSETEKPVVQLGPGFNAMCLMETAGQLWHVTVPTGVERTDLLDPAFWAHHAQGKTPGDEIRALAEDGSWRATYLIVDSAKNWIRVAELTFDELSREDAQASDEQVKEFLDGYKVTHRGPRKWSVLRASDGAVLQEDIGEKETAQAWLNRFAFDTIVGKDRAA